MNSRGRIVCLVSQYPAGNHIDAVAQLATEGRRIRLRLVGDGPDRTALEKPIAAYGSLTR